MSKTHVLNDLLNNPARQVQNAWPIILLCHSVISIEKWRLCWSVQRINKGLSKGSCHHCWFKRRWVRGNYFLIRCKGNELRSWCLTLWGQRNESNTWKVLSVVTSWPKPILGVEKQRQQKWCSNSIIRGCSILLLHTFYILLSCLEFCWN